MSTSDPCGEEDVMGHAPSAVAVANRSTLPSVTAQRPLTRRSTNTFKSLLFKSATGKRPEEGSSSRGEVECRLAAASSESEHAAVGATLMNESEEGSHTMTEPDSGKDARKHAPTSVPPQDAPEPGPAEECEPATNNPKFGTSDNSIGGDLTIGHAPSSIISKMVAPVNRSDRSMEEPSEVPTMGEPCSSEGVMGNVSSSVDDDNRLERPVEGRPNVSASQVVSPVQGEPGQSEDEKGHASVYKPYTG